MTEFISQQERLDTVLSTLNLPPALQIRYWREDDMPAINQLLELQDWPLYPNPEEVWRHSCPTLVAEKDARVVGYIRGLTDESVIMHIADLIVDANYRGLGIGRLLIETCHLLYPTTIINLIAEKPAIPFYEAIGFEQRPECFVKKPLQRNKL